jgi:hypothetical protein
MRKFFIITALTVFGFTQVNAQEIKFGAKAGVNLANIVGDFTDDSKMLMGFHVGGVAEFAITEDFLVAPELLFSMQGNKFEYEESETFMGMTASLKEEGKLKLSYIAIPVMAKYQVFDGLTLEAGPQIGILMGAKQEYDSTVSLNGEVVVSESGSEDVKEFMSTMDLGLGLGLGYRMTNGLFFQARYNIGLSNINDFDGADDVKQQNSVIQISVGYFFN